MLCKALSDYEAGGLAHLDRVERDAMVESIRRRIADLDARLEKVGDS